jgi:cytosine/creatinine deaminase
MDDLIVQGGLVAGQQQDIAMQQGRMRVRAPGLHTTARAQLEVTGTLVLPGFVESHIHPDKAFVADRAPGLQAGGPTPHVLLAELKKALTGDDVYQRARRALR